MGLLSALRKNRRIRELEEENKRLRARAERAEQFWGERQKDVADLASALQLEKQKAAAIEAQAMKKMTQSGFVVDAFCGIVGITREELLADLNFKWEEKLKQALLENNALKGG